MSDNVIHVGDTVQITADISVLGLITIHAGTEAEVLVIHDDGTCLVKVGGLLGITATIDLGILIKVG
jgi:hypothetical protein